MSKDDQPGEQLKTDIGKLLMELFHTTGDAGAQIRTRFELVG